MFQRRSQPSSWEEEVLSVRGQAGQGFAGSSGPTGGLGMISICITDLQPWRCAVPMQSDPVSPPPITSTCLPLQLTRCAVSTSAPYSTRFCWASRSRAK